MPPQQVSQLSLLLKAGLALNADLVAHGFLQPGFKSSQGQSPQPLWVALSRSSCPRGDDFFPLYVKLEAYCRFPIQVLTFGV